MGEKNWPKSVKKCQKEPKFVFRARAPLPACWPEGPAPEAPRLQASEIKVNSYKMKLQREKQPHQCYLCFSTTF